MTNENHEPDTDSGRKVVKKGALSGTVLAGGAGVLASTVTADDELFVMPGQSFYPDADFDVLARFETATRNDFIEHYDTDERVFVDPRDWTVYSILLELADGEELGLLMLKNNDDVDPEPGDSGTLGDRAAFRSTELNLLEIEVDI